MWYIIHRPTSSYAKKIARALNLTRITEDDRRVFNDSAPYIINYGLSKSKLEAHTFKWTRIFPEAQHYSIIINHNIPKSKYWAVNNVTVDHPESKRKLRSDENPSDYIVKRFYSIGQKVENA